MKHRLLILFSVLYSMNHHNFYTRILFTTIIFISGRFGSCTNNYDVISNVSNVLQFILFYFFSVLLHPSIMLLPLFLGYDSSTSIVLLFVKPLEVPHFDSDCLSHQYVLFNMFISVRFACMYMIY